MRSACPNRMVFARVAHLPQLFLHDEVLPDWSTDPQPQLCIIAPGTSLALYDSKRNNNTSWLIYSHIVMTRPNPRSKQASTSSAGSLDNLGVL